MLLANSEKDCIMSISMGFIHSFLQHVFFLPVQIEGLWKGSALIKHKRHLATVDLKDFGSKSLTKPDSKIKNTGRGVKCNTGLELICSVKMY